MSKLFDFLTDLATNPKQQQAFVEDPILVMDVLDLSESEKMAIATGNIAALFKDDFFQSAISVTDPSPDPLPDPDPPEPPPDSEPTEDARLKVCPLVVSGKL